MPGGGLAVPVRRWQPMSTRSSNPHPHDRRTDTPAPPGQPPVAPGGGAEPGGMTKPAVLRRSTLRTLCVVWLGLVIYGTLGPLGYRGDEMAVAEWIVPQWLAPVENWSWFPPGHAVNYHRYNDVFTNVLVYVPVGIALALLIRRRGGVRGLELLLAMSLAVGLSYVTELLQQFMPARSADRGDLLVNSAAALLGCLIAPRAQRVIRQGHEYAYERWRDRPWLVLAWVMTGLTLALMTLPWDLYWPSIEVEYQRSLDPLDFRRFATFGLLGFLIAMAMIERYGPRGQALGEAIKRIFVCGVLFESAQMFVKSHACGLLDMGTAFVGGLLGIGAASWLAGRSLTRGGLPTAARRASATLLLVGLVLFGLIAGMSGTDVLGADPQGPRVLWCPFQVQFLESFDRVLINAAESLLLYATVAMLCLYLTGGHGQCVALLLLLGMVGVAQTAQILVVGRVADVTPLFMAVAAWLLAVRCWNAFVPRRRRQNDGMPVTDVV